MKILKNTTIAVFVLCMLSLESCKEILEPQPQGQVALENLLATEGGLQTAVNGVYQPLLSLHEGQMQRLTALASDDGWTWRNELEPDLYVVQANFAHSETVWRNHYNGITRANTVLDNVALLEVFSSDAVKKSIEGQTKFLRAYYYFNLVRLFGGVPLLVNEVKSREDAELPRATIVEVYAQIKTDLDAAITLLPASYSGASGLEKGRVTAHAASALKAIVHLELEEWDAAAAATASVLASGSLLANYADNFNGAAENGPGSLFEVQYGGVNGETTTSLSNYYAPTSARGAALILPTDEDLNGTGGGPSSGNSFVQAIELGDLRKDVLIATYDLPNFIDASRPDGSLFYVNKFYNTTDPIGLSSWNFPLIRYAEVLLVRAEALNEAAYIADGEAFGLLNSVRTKAGLSSLTSADLTNQDEFRVALKNERRIELGFENKRYFDLNRWGSLKAAIQPQLDFLNLQFPVINTITHPVTGKNYYLYPIPSTEFINNAQLGEQNPGYN